MKVHEYQAKEILARYGVAIPRSLVITAAEEARHAAEELGGKVVVKAQVHAGGRGKAGGVKLAQNPDDAVQVAGKLPIDFRRLGVAAMTIAAHKFRGPLGIGALFLRHDVPIQPLTFGGHQQDGLRPGTESVALAVGMLTALEIWDRDRHAHARRLTALRERFEAGLKDGWPEIVVHGARAERLPHTSNIGFPGLDGQVLLMALDMAGVACSVGSACSSGSTQLSPTLRAMGLPMELVRSSLRFSLGGTTTGQEIEEAVRRILEVCDQLRA